MPFYSLIPAFIAATSLAAPQGGSVPPPGSTCGYKYTIDSQGQVDGAEHNAGGWCTPEGGETCHVDRQVGYGVEVTVTVGADLGLDFEGIGAGLSASYSYTTSTTTADTTGGDCPADKWSCGLAVTASMLRVTGQKQLDRNVACIDPPNVQEGAYDVQFPLLQEDNIPILGTHICTCPEQPNADVPGGPVLCPSSCNGS